MLTTEPQSVLAPNLKEWGENKRSCVFLVKSPVCVLVVKIRRPEAPPTLKRTIEQGINRTIESASCAEKHLADAWCGEEEKGEIIFSVSLCLCGEYPLCVFVVKAYSR
jgi:hypothetical protein